jgi:outer membrane protein insertion porin family
VVQNGINFTKLFIPLLIGFFCFTQQAVSQDLGTDTTDTFTIENPLESSPEQYTVTGIAVTGLTATRKSFVVSQLGFKKGSTITIPGDDISTAIERLYQTGLFSDIQIIRKQTTDEGIALEVRVQEQPRLRNFEIRGVKRSQRTDLRERFNLLPGFAVTQSSRVQAINTINRYYKEKGYWDTAIEVSTGEVDTVRNRLTLFFDIEAGERLEVKNITFEGNEKFSDGALRKSLASIQEDRWWQFFSKKLYKEEEYETAKDNLRAFYAENGYLDFRVIEDTVYTFPYDQKRLYVFNTPATGLKVNMRVTEGPQYKVRNVTFDGNSVYTDEQLNSILDFEKGEVFNQTKFDANFQGAAGPGQGTDINTLYRDAGYLFSRIQPNIQVVGEDSVDISVDIFEDEIATVQQVDFTGNTKTHDDVVRRNIRTMPGETYNQSKIIRTVRELGTLGYFRPEAINPTLDPDQEAKTVDITYELDESQSTDNFEFSGGYGGGNIGVILSARVNFNNFSLQRAVRGEGWNPIPSGDGQKLSLGAQVSGRGYQSYNISFQEPWLGGKPNSFGVSLSYDLISRRNIFSTDVDERNKLFSSSISLGRRLKWPDDYFTQRSIVSYQLYDISGGTSFLAEGTSSILSFKQVVERNSVGPSPISPTRGSKVQLSAEIAPPLPGFSQFYKFKGLYENHTRLVGQLTLTNSIEYGYLGYLGSGQRSNFKRFVLGGTQLQQRQSFVDDNIDLRGFPGGRGQSISPRTANREIGGRLFSKYSLEMRIPAVQEQQVQVIPYTFFDAGNAYRNFDDFAPFDVKRATGFGLRVYLPILGLVDLSYGYRLDGIPGTLLDGQQGNEVRAGEWEFLFNLGAPF